MPAYWKSILIWKRSIYLALTQRMSHGKTAILIVAVVVKHVEGDFFSVNPLLWKLRRQIDDRIEPILIEKDNDEAGFLGDIQNNGIEII